MAITYITGSTYQQSKIVIHFTRDVTAGETNFIDNTIEFRLVQSTYMNYNLKGLLDDEIYAGYYRIRNNQALPNTQTQFFSDGFNLTYLYLREQGKIEYNYNQFDDTLTIINLLNNERWNYVGTDYDFLDVKIYYNPQSIPLDLEIDTITVSLASTNRQSFVRYNFTVNNATYPFNITSPISKIVNNVSEQWIEYYRFPGAIANLSISNSTSSDTKPIPRVEVAIIVSASTVNVETNTASVEIFTGLAVTDSTNIIKLNSLDFKLDNGVWNNVSFTNMPVTYTFTNVGEGTHIAYIRDIYEFVHSLGNIVVEFESTGRTITFKIMGDKPPFNVELYQSNDKTRKIDSITLATSGSSSLFTGLLVNNSYSLFVRDSVGNTDEYTVTT